jgi:hypothetical protein
MLHSFLDFLLPSYLPPSLPHPIPFIRIHHRPHPQVGVEQAKLAGKQGWEETKKAGRLILPPLCMCVCVCVSVKSLDFFHFAQFRPLFSYLPCHLLLSSFSPLPHLLFTPYRH